MTDTFKFPKREDNSTEDAEKVVAWARKFKGVDAHIVIDYISVGNGAGGTMSVPGALNGVTLQWDHDDDGVADGAIHARPGSTITRTANGFEVVADEVTL